MGDKIAPKEFLEPFHDSITAWQLRELAMQPASYMRCPELVDDLSDSSITSFATDVWGMFVLAKGTAEDATDTV